MRPVSAAFLATVTGGHAMAARARVCTTFQEGVDPDGTEVGIISGEVSGDVTASVRHQLTMSTPGHQWNTGPNGMLTPYGSEVYVERGIDFGDHIEWVGLGYFKILDAAQGGDSDQPVEIEGADRMHGIEEATLAAPRQFSAFSQVGATFTQLVRDVYPNASPVVFDDEDLILETVGRSTFVEKDVAGFLHDLAASYGKVFFAGHDGIFRVQDPPDPLTPTVKLHGGRGGVLIDTSFELTRDGVYNAVVAYGEGTDDIPPVRAVARDMNPLSPTYWDGTYGHVPRYYSSPFIKTQAQAESAARKMLRQAIARPLAADFSAVPNPALEVGDTIAIKDRATGIERTYTLRELTIPLTADGAMTGAVEDRVELQIGGVQ